MRTPPRGPLFIDLPGTELSGEDRALLEHPLVGGVVLFTRNLAERGQLLALTRELKAFRGRDLVIAIDHEGGRVQRFREEGFAPLPPAALFGWLGDRGRESDALTLARDAARLLAEDLVAAGIDITFAPVVDCHHPTSTVLGDRTLHGDPMRIVALARAVLGGLHAGGVAGCIKHYPGHGGVSEDSHLELPVDERPLSELRARDLVPYVKLADAEALMTAHVAYPEIDGAIPCFSPFWLQTVLRKELRFNGVIVSDDLTMAGAVRIEPRPEDRVARALAAGCDIVLMLNDRDGVIAALDGCRSITAPPDQLWKRWAEPVRAARGAPPLDRADTLARLSAAYENYRDALANA